MGILRSLTELAHLAESPQAHLIALLTSPNSGHQVYQRCPVGIVGIGLYISRNLGLCSRFVACSVPTSPGTSRSKGRMAAIIMLHLLSLPTAAIAASCVTTDHQSRNKRVKFLPLPLLLLLMLRV